MFKGAWVYILCCCDGSYYVGCTTAIEKRLVEHKLGIFPGYTSARRPVTLVWCEELPDIFQAIVVERQIKGWSRKKKEALIRGEVHLLHELAACKNKTHFSNRPMGARRITKDSLHLRSD
jgi:putative endonuclease